jgi:hypothetical protein
MLRTRPDLVEVRYEPLYFVRVISDISRGCGSPHGTSRRRGHASIRHVAAPMTPSAG